MTTILQFPQQQRHDSTCPYDPKTAPDLFSTETFQCPHCDCTVVSGLDHPLCSPGCQRYDPVAAARARHPSRGFGSSARPQTIRLVKSHRDVV